MDRLHALAVHQAAQLDRALPPSTQHDVGRVRGALAQTAALLQSFAGPLQGLVETARTQQADVGRLTAGWEGEVRAVRERLAHSTEAQAAHTALLTPVPPALASLQTAQADLARRVDRGSRAVQEEVESLKRELGEVARRTEGVESRLVAILDTQTQLLQALLSPTRPPLPPAAPPAPARSPPPSADAGAGRAAGAVRSSFATRTTEGGGRKRRRRLMDDDDGDDDDDDARPPSPTSSPRKRQHRSQAPAADPSSSDPSSAAATAAGARTGRRGAGGARSSTPAAVDDETPPTAAATVRPPHGRARPAGAGGSGSAGTGGGGSLDLELDDLF